MSKQIEFFSTNDDEFLFLKYIKDNGYLIYDKFGNILDNITSIKPDEISLFLSYDSAYLNLSSGYINAINSEVIQMSRSILDNQKVLMSGRLWVTFKYWNSEYKNINKDEQLSNIFNCLSKYIKKNMINSKCKHYYIGINTRQYCIQKNILTLSGPKHIVDFD